MPLSIFKYLQHSEELDQHLPKLSKNEMELHSCDTLLSSQITLPGGYNSKVQIYSNWLV